MRALKMRLLNELWNASGHVLQNINGFAASDNNLVIPAMDVSLWAQSLGLWRTYIGSSFFSCSCLRGPESVSEDWRTLAAEANSFNRPMAAS